MKSNGGMWSTRIAVLSSFFVVVVAITVFSVFGRALVWYTSAVQNVVVVVGALLVAAAGWVSVSRLHFGLRWTPVLGIVLSLGSHWSLFVVHELREIPPLVLVNSAILAALAFIGGFVAMVYARLRARAM